MFLGITLRHVGRSQAVVELAESLAKTEHEVAVFIEEQRQPDIPLPVPVYPVSRLFRFTAPIIATTPFSCDLAYRYGNKNLCYFAYAPIHYSPSNEIIVIIRSPDYATYVGGRYNHVVTGVDIDALADVIRRLTNADNQRGRNAGTTAGRATR